MALVSICEAKSDVNIQMEQMEFLQIDHAWHKLVSRAQLHRRAVQFMIDSDHSLTSTRVDTHERRLQ